MPLEMLRILYNEIPSDWKLGKKIECFLSYFNTLCQSNRKIVLSASSQDEIKSINLIFHVKMDFPEKMKQTFFFCLGGTVFLMYP